ncbi:MAG: DUF177 domain-containing protein [Lentisphaerae bacterium]|nr:DUF177 domain-containing protein [Lentisphaerota bacterium]
MQIDIFRLPPEGETFRGEEPGSTLEVDGEPGLRQNSPVRYDFTAHGTSGELIVKGRLAVDMSFRCRRCGEFFVMTVEEGRFNRVLEVSDENALVDLTPEIREAMILAFPSYPQCRSECRGLCSQCGKDLNAEQCGCGAPPDGRWGELDNIELG